MIKSITWSPGKILGIFAIILLLIGPFLPFYVLENMSTGWINESNHLEHWFDNLDTLSPFLTVIFILIMLYPEFPIYFEKKFKYGKINHLFLMIWGALWSYSYFNNAIRHISTRRILSVDYYIYPGYGHWLIILGFIFCSLAGFLEWRFPTMANLTGLLGLKKEIETEPDGEPVQKQVASEKIEDLSTEPMAKVKVSEVEPEGKSLPPQDIAFEKPMEIETETKAITSEEKKTLLRWARHIDEYNQSYEQCMNCQNYAFMKAKVMEDTITFTCPECDETFTLIT
jgi:hypothetical protein